MRGSINELSNVGLTGKLVLALLLRLNFCKKSIFFERFCASNSTLTGGIHSHPTKFLSKDLED